MKLHEEIKAFKMPDWRYRAKPFWSWNGDLEADELIRQIDRFKEMGMGGYFCHSRIGLETEYLGEKWFELIDLCAEHGKKTDMQTWLYDEDRWPSGTAGGLVTKHPEYRLKFIRMELFDGNTPVEFKDNTIAWFSAEVDGLNFKNKKRLFPGDISQGDGLICFSVEEMEKEEFYNGYTYADTMNPETTKKFLEVTHERYASACKNLGTDIAGIFTDEPHRGAVMCAFGIKNKDAYYLTPYTPALFDEFKSDNGYSLEDYLPELFLQKNGESISQVKLHYMRTIERLFINNFLKPIQEWCHEHGMKLTGHLLHEDTLTAQSCMMGSLQRGYEYFDVPGVDTLGTYNELYWIAKQVVSTARQLGQKEILSEEYGCTGWHLRFKEYKAIGDWQALFGITLRCPHLSWYWMKGDCKRDYPSSISGQSAWHREYHYIEDYYARINTFMEKGAPVCNILVLNPIESVWMHIHAGWSQTLGTNDEYVHAIEQRYFDLFNILCSHRFDFDYGDEDIIARYASVERLGDNAVLRIGEAVYEKLLISGVETLRPSTVKLLKEFSEAGGYIVVAGEFPSYCDALPDESIKDMTATHIPYEEEEIVKALGSSMVNVTLKDGRNAGKIFAQIGKGENGYRVMLLNVDRNQGFKECTVNLSLGGCCEKWNVRDGSVTLLTKGDPISFTYDFAPSEELCIFVADTDRGLLEDSGRGELIRSVELPEKMKYCLDEPNVCTLNFMDYSINGDEYTCHRDVIDQDKYIRETVGLKPRSGEMLQPWFTKDQTYPELCELTMNFNFIVQQAPKKIQLVVEIPENFEIQLNGYTITESSEDFWIDSCFTVFDIDADILTVGSNVLTMKTGYRYDVNLEYPFLIGDFGVSINEDEIPIITALPESLALGDITEQGMPFYGAGVSYTVQVPQLSVEERLWIVTDAAEAACIRVSNGTDSEIIAFYPLEADITELARGNDSLEIKYVFNRKNTFEPCMEEIYFKGHYVLQKQGMCSPMHFEIRK